ncbi:MAG: 30S ribosome-binding factor RbfA [Desulfobulbaceae bacterium]|jgi:ribosome-binding factor A|nr:30S ribosome-binding factor RbfA [Desulfobulbaceae bacterium]
MTGVKQTAQSLGLGKKTRKRPARVADAVMRELALLLLQDSRDPLLREVCITRVTATDDLRLATVYFTCLAGPDAASTVIKALRHAAGYMRGHLAHTLNMRFTPDLHFRYDSTAVEAERLERIFQDIGAERQSDESDS